MNWISALSPMQWLLMMAIPPAVLSLYFLKLKRRELVVPSTLLWKKAMEDIHVNSIWQRLRKNLLLYLQLLFLALIVLACLRPGWIGERLQQRTGRPPSEAFGSKIDSQKIRSIEGPSSAGRGRWDWGVKSDK